MAMEWTEIQELAAKFRAGIATPEERTQLHTWFDRQEPPAEAGSDDAVLVPLPGPMTREQYRNLIFSELQERIRADRESEENAPATPVYRIPVLRRNWVRYAAAVILLLCVGGYLYRTARKSPTDLVSTPSLHPTLNNDIAPGGNKAILTLAGGRQVILDSAHQGSLTMQGNAQVIKLDSGRLAYKVSGATDRQPLLYNTLATPRGGQYQLTLPDGTRVWLDAASSITYPTVFSDKERIVRVTGQLYFEVAHRADQPFRVIAAGMEIKDIGTAFNVNTFADEPAARITLVEGSIAVRKKDQALLLQPGQQALSAGDLPLKLHTNADLQQVLAWKNGLISLGGTSIGEIMRQISRWYDVDIHYEGDLGKAVFAGVVSRRQHANDLLRIMQLTGSVQFSVDGKTITVKPGAHAIK